jgi:FXSXX-COOH protein
MHGEPVHLTGDLIDVSGLSLRDLDKLHKNALAQELRRLLGHVEDDENAVNGFRSSI